MVVCWFGWVGRSALVRRTAVIVAVLGVLAMLPAPADAEAAAGQYVALGDSYSSGVGHRAV